MSISRDEHPLIRYMQETEPLLIPISGPSALYPLDTKPGHEVEAFGRSNQGDWTLIKALVDRGLRRKAFDGMETTWVFFWAENSCPPLVMERLVMKGSHWALTHDSEFIHALGHRLSSYTNYIERYEDGRWLSRNYHDRILIHRPARFIFYRASGVTKPYAFTRVLQSYDAHFDDAHAVAA